MRENEQVKKDKEATKRRLVKAVGELLKSAGPKSLGINKIAKAAGVDKKLIYRYFGGADQLIETYITENDYWLAFGKKIQELIQSENQRLPDMVAQLLKQQFNHFEKDENMQLLVILELTGAFPIMKSIHNTREALAEDLLEMIHVRYEGNQVNFRAIAALLVGGIYYTILHSRSNGNIFTGLDILSESGKKDIRQAIDFIIDAALSRK